MQSGLVLRHTNANMTSMTSIPWWLVLWSDSAVRNESVTNQWISLTFYHEFVLSSNLRPKSSAKNWRAKFSNLLWDKFCRCHCIFGVRFSDNLSNLNCDGPCCDEATTDRPSRAVIQTCSHRYLLLSINTRRDRYRVASSYVVPRIKKPRMMVSTS